MRENQSSMLSPDAADGSGRPNTCGGREWSGSRAGSGELRLGIGEKGTAVVPVSNADDVDGLTFRPKYRIDLSGTLEAG